MIDLPTLTNPVIRINRMRPRSTDWLQLKDAAALLGVQPNTLHYWRIQNKLEGVRVWKSGAYHYYHRADIEKLAQLLKQGPTEEQAE